MTGPHAVGSSPPPRIEQPPQAEPSTDSLGAPPPVPVPQHEPIPLDVALPAATVDTATEHAAPPEPPHAPVPEKRPQKQLIGSFIRGTLLTALGPATHLTVINNMPGLQAQLGESFAGRLNASCQYLAAAGLLFGMKAIHHALATSDQLLPSGVSASVIAGRKLLRGMAVAMIGAGIVTDYILTLRGLNNPASDQHVLLGPAAVAIAFGAMLAARAVGLGTNRILPPSKRPPARNDHTST